jgi:DNA helicase-2/ATP-dependent DNA helicase PcrA
MQRYKILGPPGTGKTTRLLALLEKELETVPPKRIAFVSFTRRGTYEGAQRAKERFAFDDAQLCHFRTLHSLCFRQTGSKHGRIMQKKDYYELGKKLGLKFDVDESALAILSEKNDATYLAACSLAMHNPATYDKLIVGLNYTKLLYVAKNLQAYKETYGCIDFTDMMFNYYKYGDPLDVDVVFVDEAQDLTTLQWVVVDKMFAGAKRMYIAGDDDQAIYTWAGADVDEFMKREAATEILQQSNRLPVKVHRYALNVLKGISHRTHKDFRPRDEQGDVDVAISWTKALARIDRHTLILSRDRMELGRAAKALQEAGLLYTYKGESSFPLSMRRAIEAYEQWRTSPEPSFYPPLRSFEREWFSKTGLEIPWYDALKSRNNAQYFKRVLERESRGEQQAHKIELSTIHAAKGSECEHVILALGYRLKTDSNYRRDPDSELRCLYVGATRAKQKLTLKLKEQSYGYPSFTQLDPRCWLDDAELKADEWF